MSSARPALTVDRDMAPSCSLLGATLAALFSVQSEDGDGLCCLTAAAAAGWNCFQILNIIYHVLFLFKLINNQITDKSQSKSNSDPFCLLQRQDGCSRKRPGCGWHDSPSCARCRGSILISVYLRQPQPPSSVTMGELILQSSLELSTNLREVSQCSSLHYKRVQSWHMVYGTSVLESG